MRFVAGLGNPGERYRQTRHNAGFMVVDALASRSPGIVGGQEAGAWVAQARLGTEPVLLVKPLSFMNLSGEPVVRLLDIHRATAADLVVVVDDVALDLGAIRIRERGSDGGHNGLSSLIRALGTQDFARVRVGVGQDPLPEDLAPYVLADFPPEDREAVAEVVDRAAAAVTCLVTEGPAAAMSRYNTRRS